MSTKPVKWFSSVMAGAPQLSWNAGTTIGCLDACLLNGFNTKTISAGNLTYDSGTNTCTATITAHGFLKYQVVLVAGCDQSNFNGESRITFTDSNTVKWTPDAVPQANTATTSSSMTMKTAPLTTWTKQYSASNKAAYKSTEAGATGILLRLDDTNTVTNWNTSGASLAATMYETMSDINTGVACSNNYWWKKDYANSGALVRDWFLIGDSRMFFWIPYTYNFTSLASGTVNPFGDIISYRPGDAYNCILQANTNTNSYGGSYFPQFTTNSYKYIARKYHQGPGYDNFTCVGHGLSIYSGYNSNNPYPNPADNGIYVHDQILVLEAAGSIVRGEVPGMKQLLHTLPLPHGVIQDAMPGRAGGSLYLPLTVGQFDNATSQLAQVLFDLVGPWR